jgi:V/A-type H+-transporting ATPase subunit K
MLELIMALATFVLQTNPAPAIPPTAAAALERGIGAAAVGAIAEDDDMFGRGLILTVLPETLVILALVVIFVV